MKKKLYVDMCLPEILMEVPTPCVGILECDLGNRVFVHIIKLREIVLAQGEP